MPVGLPTQIFWNKSTQLLISLTYSNSSRCDWRSCELLPVPPIEWLTLLSEKYLTARNEILETRNIMIIMNMCNRFSYQLWQRMMQMERMHRGPSQWWMMWVQIVLRVWQVLYLGIRYGALAVYLEVNLRMAVPYFRLLQPSYRWLQVATILIPKSSFITLGNPPSL